MLELPTVQGVIESAFEQLFGRYIGTVVSSRTDAGVHALWNTFHIDLPLDQLAPEPDCATAQPMAAPATATGAWPCGAGDADMVTAALDAACDVPTDQLDEPMDAVRCAGRLSGRRPFTTPRLIRALNHHLPPRLPVRILAAQRVPLAVHARFSATYRTYLYRLGTCRGVCPAIEMDRAWMLRTARPLDVPAMQAAAALLVGHHDFSTFVSSTGQPNERLVRTLDELAVRSASVAPFYGAGPYRCAAAAAPHSAHWRR